MKTLFDWSPCECVGVTEGSALTLGERPSLSVVGGGSCTSFRGSTIQCDLQSVPVCTFGPSWRVKVIWHRVYFIGIGPTDPHELFQLEINPVQWIIPHPPWYYESITHHGYAQVQSPPFVL